MVAGGVCVVAPGGMRGCSGGGGGHAWLLGGHAWLLGGVRGFIWGGMHGFIRGGVCGFFSFFGYNEIGSMSGRYASYWNAFLLMVSCWIAININFFFFVSFPHFLYPENPC